MPKALSEKEKSIIRTRLLVEAEQGLKIYGAKKTTVDLLVSRVNIPKGTFYLFYQSKELLFYELFRKKHDEIQDSFLKKMEPIKNNVSISALTNLIFTIYQELDQSFLLKFVASGDLELVLRKLSFQEIEKHIERDDLMMEELIKMIPHIDKNKHKEYSGALRIALASILHKDEIGKDIFDGALKLTISGIVTKMFQGDEQ